MHATGGSGFEEIGPALVTMHVSALWIERMAQQSAGELRPARVDIARVRLARAYQNSTKSLVWTKRA